jgi:hypothetical protein
VDWVLPGDTRGRAAKQATWSSKNLAAEVGAFFLAKKHGDQFMFDSSQV